MSAQEIRQQDQELKDLYKKFDDNFKKLATSDDDEFIDKFTELAEKIVEYNSIDCLKFLLQYFHDEHEGYNGLCWLQENLKSIIETINDELYVKRILSNLHLMLPHAKDWASYLINRILGNSSCKILFYHNMHLADKNLLRKFFDDMLTEGYLEYEEINILIHKLNYQLQ